MLRGNLMLHAMNFAYSVHANQKRKYTGEPYFAHLAEVVGIVSSFAFNMFYEIETDHLLATAWLHDCMEDQGVTHQQLSYLFGDKVADGVRWLSDMETGNRAERKAASRERLSRAPNWVQTIKCADLISNTKSIVQHDPKFAVTYLEEKRLLLDVLTQADRHAVKMAKDLVKE